MSRMEREVGNKDFAIWLLGDSNPKNWQDKLLTPLDPRHPARHSIWTPILDAIQDRLFRQCRIRMDTSSLYVRNAIENSDQKPRGAELAWKTEVEQEIEQFRQLIHKHKPKLVLCFGAFAFEFARRVDFQKPEQNYGYWGAKRLGQEFSQRIDRFDIHISNILPLLHASIARGRFIQSHDYFCDKEGENYFKYVGNCIVDKLIKHQDQLSIWIQ